mmetsp:Transcript_64846/g.204748  ORF Transcript_64846/g.204748 Transcript_64846/m.204748 type:complete len:215 (-) Transcript_64846:145-789(-)
MMMATALHIFSSLVSPTGTAAEGGGGGGERSGEAPAFPRSDLMPTAPVARPCSCRRAVRPPLATAASTAATLLTALPPPVTARANSTPCSAGADSTSSASAVTPRARRPASSEPPEPAVASDDAARSASALGARPLTVYATALRATWCRRRRPAAPAASAATSTLPSGTPTAWATAARRAGSRGEPARLVRATRPPTENAGAPLGTTSEGLFPR